MFTAASVKPSLIHPQAYVESVPRRRRMIATGDGNCGQHTQILLWIEDKGTPAKVPSKLWVALPRLVGCVPSIHDYVIDTVYRSP